MYRFGTASEARLKTVLPVLAEVPRLALSYNLMDFAIISGGRTQEKQDTLFAQGRTMPGPVVTWTRNSNHLILPNGYGRAFDAAPYLGGKLQWRDHENFKLLATLMFRAAMELGIQIRWGFHAWGKDLAHFDLLEKKE